MSETYITTTCPRDCYDSCGIRVVLNDGKIDRVTGDAGHPANRGSLCGKCALAYNGVWRDENARLSTPLRRIGAKGEGRFEPISWDEALETVAGKLNGLLSAGRHQDIITAHYTGTCSAIANQFPMRLLNVIGATEVDPDSVCNLSGHVALDYVLGESTKGFDPRTARDAQCLVVWGGNPSASGPHVDKHWLAEFGGTVVVIDPIVTPTAKRADIHLRPFPGTDAALAFAMMHALKAQGALDAAFIAAHTVGFEHLEVLIDAWSPERAAEVTGVAPADIVAAAQAYGAGPSLLWLGQALCRGPTGGNAFRAAAMLPAVTGNIGKPGTGLLFLNGKGATRGLDMGYVGRADLRASDSETVSHMDLRERLEQVPDSALLLWNINIAASNPDQQRLLQALRSPDLFTVVAELFMTDSARYADIVLPAASFLEFDDLVGSYFHLSVGPQAKATEPVGEALPNQEIFRRLARVMDRTESELFESDESVLAHLMAPLGMSFDALKARGTVYPSAEPVVLWADLTFPTPSGKIELASERAAAAGLPLTPIPDPLPRPAGDALRLLTPADEWHMNSSYDNEPRIRQRTPQAQITLNSADASARGLKGGETVTVWNDVGRLTMALRVDDMTPVGVAWAPKGQWPSHATDGLNVNALNSGLRADMGDSTALHGVEVKVAIA
ncbi:MAG: anaerobic selenocysteine-containing dehydrogenase [Gammaproteobacteria bacterium]|jgi:anaerobic selenocysteine-containing dehydrogenase